MTGSVEVFNYIFFKVYAVPDNGKCSKMFDLSMLAEYGTILCSSTSIYDNVVESLINNHKDGQNRPLVLILGSYYKRGFVEILDPSNSKDPSAFDKCYWLVYFSVQGFLKTIKDEKESESNKNIIQDTVNRNSKGFKRKTRKKSIQTEIQYFPSFESPDIIYQRPIFSFSPPSPEWTESKIEDIVNKSSQKRSLVYQENIPDFLLYIPLKTEATFNQRSFHHTVLTPPQVFVEFEAIPDMLNYPPPQHSCCDHDAHWPDVTYPIPPLIYNVDVRTEILPFSPAPAPATEGDDCVNTPQPVKWRHYFNDQDHVVLNLQDVEEGHHIQDHHHHQSPPTFHLSAPGSPRLPHHDQDTVNKTPVTSPHLSLCHHISPPGHFPPGDVSDTKSRLNIELQPPQQALYIQIEDSYLLNRSYSKCVPNHRISSSIFCKTPMIPPQVRSPSIGFLSPPQSPEMPMRRESKVEDLFDQVRRHSRGLNFYR